MTEQHLAPANRAPIWLRALASIWLSFWFVFVYNGCNYVSSIRDDVGTCAYPWELDLFAFIPILIIPYWSIDFLYGLAPLLMKDRFMLRQHVKRITFGITVAGVFFLIFPLKLAFQRPEVHGWLAPFFSSLENFNNFYNCAPSLHIVLLTNLWAVYFRLIKGWMRYGMYLWFILIEASTLFCYQHHILTGQLLGLFCLWLFPEERFSKVKTDPENGVNCSPKISRVYGAGYLTMAVLAVLTWREGTVFLWPAGSLLILTAAYGGGGPILFRKHRGRQLLATRWLLNPYRWVAQQTANYFNREGPAYGELEPGLYIGRKLSNQEASEMEVNAVLDLTAEYDECDVLLEKNYLNIPILDLTCPSLRQLQEAVEFLEHNPNCYLHCSLGRGRTGAVAVAYLISKGHSYEDALEKVRAVRPNISLAHGLEDVLRRFGNSPKC